MVSEGGHARRSRNRSRQPLSSRVLGKRLDSLFPAFATASTTNRFEPVDRDRSVERAPVAYSLTRMRAHPAHRCGKGIFDHCQGLFVLSLCSQIDVAPDIQSCRQAGLAWRRKEPRRWSGQGALGAIRMQTTVSYLLSASLQYLQAAHFTISSALPSLAFNTGQSGRQKGPCHAYDISTFLLQVSSRQDAAS